MELNCKYSAYVTSIHSGCSILCDNPNCRKYLDSFRFLPKRFNRLMIRFTHRLLSCLALLLVAEGLLLIKNGSKGTSPKLVKSRRGQSVGAHEVRRFLDGADVSADSGRCVNTYPFEWWPVFHIGAETYSLLFVPFAVGFNQQIQGMLPKQSIEIHGRRVLHFRILTLYFLLWVIGIRLLSIVVAAFAIIGREMISLMQRMKDDNLPFYFSKKKQWSNDY